MMTQSDHYQFRIEKAAKYKKNVLKDDNYNPDQDEEEVKEKIKTKKVTWMQRQAYIFVHTTTTWIITIMIDFWPLEYPPK